MAGGPGQASFSPGKVKALYSLTALESVHPKAYIYWAFDSSGGQPWLRQMPPPGGFSSLRLSASGPYTQSVGSRQAIFDKER